MVADDLHVFFGEATDTLARVYVELTGPDASQCQITGVVVGPRCEYAKTLPARLPLRSRPDGDSPRAEAVIPDPCFWTPRMPFLYDVQIDVRCSGQTLYTERRPLGIRRLGVRGRDLFLDGRRIVLRAISDRCLTEFAETVEAPTNVVAACHDSEAALLQTVPRDALCDAASRLGALLLVDCRGGVAEIDCRSGVLETDGPEDAESGALAGEGVARKLNRVSRWPSAAIAVLTGVQNVARADIPRNLLLAQRVAGDEAATVAPWVHLVLLEANDAAAIAERAADFDLPILAYRPLATARSIHAARAACDQLQRDLAPYGDFAGYIV